MTRRFRRALAPISKQLPKIRAAARMVSHSPRQGLKLLIQSKTSRGPRIEPDVYPFAAFLAGILECTNIIIIGKPAAHELVQLLPQFRVTGVVGVEQIRSCRKQFPMIAWIAAPTRGEFLLPEETLQGSLIICTGVIDTMANPTFLLRQIEKWMDHAALCLLTTAHRDILEMQDLLSTHRLNSTFIGLTATNSESFAKKTVLAIVQNNSLPRPGNTVTPSDFRVVAFMAAYNEADIIVQSIKKWTDQGVHVHILENWSTDATYDLIQAASLELPVTCERFPPDGPSPYFDWQAMLERIECLAQEFAADWFVRRGADEILASPWPGISYRDALYLVDCSGFNCVDHTIVEFYPVDNGFAAGMDHEAYFRNFDFQRLSHQWQRKAWKNCGAPASSIKTAGHDVTFAGRRIYPFKFLLKHYSFRSQAHGEKKVFRERKPRWNSAERARGWHIHYDSIKQGHQFVQSPSAKEAFDEYRFNEMYLVERLSGVGINR
jgi:hypothetical protein